MAKLNRRPSPVGRCIMENCTSPARTRGLCSACYSWYWYHKNEEHDPLYFRDYRKRHQRILSRVDAFQPSRARFKVVK
jgi:hypothetical protein